MIEQIANLYIYGILCSDAFRYYTKQRAHYMVLRVSLLFMKVLASNSYNQMDIAFLERFKNIRFFLLLTI